MKYLSLSALFFVCLSSMAMTINDLVPGQTASGQQLAPSDLKGKVVFVAYWGIDCPHCIAEIPQWDALYKKFHAEGFEIIAMERHHTSESTIAALARSYGLEFTLSAGGSLKGAVVTRIPHGFLFGPDGNLVQENPYVYDLDSRVAALIKESRAAQAVAASEAKSPIPVSQPAPEIAPNTSPKDSARAAQFTVEKKIPAKYNKMCGAFCCEETDATAVRKLAESRLDLEAEAIKAKSKVEPSTASLAASLLEFEANTIKEKLNAKSPKYSAERFAREAEALREKLKLDANSARNDATAGTHTDSLTILSGNR